MLYCTARTICRSSLCFGNRTDSRGVETSGCGRAQRGSPWRSELSLPRLRVEQSVTGFFNSPTRRWLIMGGIDWR